MSITGKNRSAKPRQARKHAGKRLRVPAPAKKQKLRCKAPATAGDSSAFLLPLSVTRTELLDENGGRDHRFRQLLFDFATLGASLEVARAHLASLLGLSSPQYNIAMILVNHQNTGGITVSGVAKRLHVSTAFITVETSKLEQAGIVERRPNPGDGRSILLRLSPSGANLVQRIGLERQMINDLLFASLSTNAFRNLSKTLSTLIDDFSYTLSLLKHVHDGSLETLSRSEANQKPGAR